MGTSERVDRAALIGRNEAVWEALASTFAGVKAEHAERVSVGSWSAKDHLVHVVAWEYHRLAVLLGGEPVAVMGFAPEEWAAAGEDALNALIAQRTHDRPFAAVLDDLRATRAALGEALRAIPDDRLATSYRTLHPEDAERGDGRLGEWAVGIGEAHIGAHLGPIRARLAQARGDASPTVAAALARIDAATSELLTAMSAIADPAVADADGWRAADHVFHVAAWDRGCAALLSEASRPEALGVSAKAWRVGDVHQVNAEIFAANRDRPASAALPAFEASRALLRHAVAALEDDDLLAAYGAFQPDDPPFDFAPVHDWIAENGWVHPGEHAEAIRRLGAPTG